jgi:hypothetical protein
MSIKIVVKIVRPDKTAEFFYLADAALPYAAYTNAAVDSGIITSVTNVFSSDRLILTRMTTFRDQAAKDEFQTGFHSTYPDYDVIRENYCDEHHHILTIVTP